MDETHNHYTEFQDFWERKEKLLKQKEQTRMNAKQASLHRDTDLWETNRMLQSGVAQKRAIDLDFADEEEVNIESVLIWLVQDSCFDQRFKTSLSGRESYFYQTT